MPFASRLTTPPAAFDAWTIAATFGSGAAESVHTDGVRGPTNCRFALLMVTTSLYVPGRTLMVDPGDAALPAAWMEVKLPCGHCAPSSSTSSSV